jgi:hypothetical protein
VRRYLVAVAAAVALTVLAGTAWAYWSVGSVAGSGGAAKASTVDQGATPTANATGSTVTVSWAATTLANGVPVSGYLVKRYDATTSTAQTVLAGCAGTVTATSCVENGVPNGSWRYTVIPVFATSWQGAESGQSTALVVNGDVTAPTNSLGLSAVTGGAFLGGSTVYYRGSAAGSLRLSNAVADAGSGPASSSTATLGGTATGWTHTPSTVSSPTGGPYVSDPFSWTAGTTSSPTESVTGRDVAGNTAVSALTFTNDSTPPTPGTIGYADGPASSPSVSITFTSGSDTGSGVATRRLQRAFAAFTPGTPGACGVFGSFADLGSDSPSSPYVDSGLASGCYQYRYVVTDRLGNQTIATDTSVAKVGVDTTGPTGGSVDATGLVGTGSRYAASTTLNLALVAGTDPSGVATTGNQLLRATAPLSGGSCGTYGGDTPVASDPNTPLANTVSDGACYRYRYVVSDTVGNSMTYTSPDIKVDLATPAAPALTFSSLTNAYWPGTGSPVYYRSAATSGSLQLSATATAPSGIAGYTFPSLGNGWTASPGSTGVTTYSWSVAGPVVPGPKSVTATTNAGATSAAAAFTMVADDAAPTGAGLSYLNGSTTSTTVTVTLTNGTDAGSGLGTRLLQRASATLTNGSCGAFGAYATVVNGTNPTSPLGDVVSTNACYRYRYVVADNVGNQTTVDGSSIVRVASSYAAALAGTSGLVNWWRLDETSGTSASDGTGTNTGTYANGPTLGVAGALAGDSDTAVQLDGVDDYVAVSRPVVGDFSIELWFRSNQGIGTGTTWSSGAGLVDAGVPGTAKDFGVSLRSDGKIIAGVGGGGSETSIISGVGGFNNGAWHHVVFTRVRTSGELVLYVDGVAVATGRGGSNKLSASSTISLGRINTGTNYLRGALDEVAIYDTALSAATVSAHYSAGTTP